jgi:lycopene cyclase domain-containing protein
MEARISKVVLMVLALSVSLTYGKDYTFYTSFFTLVLLVFLVYFHKPLWLADFWRAYLVHLIPFFLVNGVLTALPVVLYNNDENLAIRIYTIPIEDSIYSMLLLLMNISIMETLRSRGEKANAKVSL